MGNFLRVDRAAFSAIAPENDAGEHVWEKGQPRALEPSTSKPSASQHVSIVGEANATRDKADFIESIAHDNFPALSSLRLNNAGNPLPCPQKALSDLLLEKGSAYLTCQRLQMRYVRNQSSRQTIEPQRGAHYPTSRCLTLAITTLAKLVLVN